MSSQHTAEALCLLCASLRIELSFSWCSVHPGMEGMKVFCSDVSKNLFCRMNFSHRLRRRVVKILPIHGVSAIGLKFPGFVASSAAGPFAISLIAAVFH